MSPNLKTTNLLPIIQNAEQLRLNLEAVIETGDEAEVDAISKIYEAELEKVFSYKSETQSCVKAKLSFTKDILLIDHPMPSLVERAFKSLSMDIEVLLAD